LKAIVFELHCPYAEVLRKPVAIQKITANTVVSLFTEKDTNSLGKNEDIKV